jgi:hypothetical protein
MTPTCVMVEWRECPSVIRGSSGRACSPPGARSTGRGAGAVGLQTVERPPRPADPDHALLPRAGFQPQSFAPFRDTGFPSNGGCALSGICSRWLYRTSRFAA